MAVSANRQMGSWSYPGLGNARLKLYCGLGRREQFAVYFMAANQELLEV